MFSFHTQNHLRIWFSGEPDSFLNPENQLRMVQFRTLNPGAKVTMLYSSRLLTPTAIDQFEYFCDIHAFELLDFDSISELCLLTNDIALYRLAQEELDAFIAERGGNLAVASDLARLISFLLGKGTYSDFDTHIEVESLDNIVPIHSPVILNIGSVGSGKSEYFQFNNDLIGVASNGELIDPAALEELQVIQDGIIHACCDGSLTVLAQRADYLKKRNPLTQIYLEGAFKILEKWDNSTISVPNFRYFLQLTCSNAFTYSRILNDEQLSSLPLSAELKEKLKETLENENYWDFPQEFVQEEIDLIIPAITDHLNAKYQVAIGERADLDTILSYLKHEWVKESESLFTGPCCFFLQLHAKSRDKLQPRSFDGNGLYKEFFSPQSNRFGTTKEDSFITLDRGGDISWLPHGQMLLKAREEKLHCAAQVIQQFWKKYSLFAKPIESAPVVDEEPPKAQYRTRAATI